MRNKTKNNNKTQHKLNMMMLKINHMTMKVKTTKDKLTNRIAAVMTIITRITVTNSTMQP